MVIRPPLFGSLLLGVGSLDHEAGFASKGVSDEPADVTELGPSTPYGTWEFRFPRSTTGGAPLGKAPLSTTLTSD